MDLWFMIKECSGFLSFFLIIILLSIFLLVATWKNRTNIPKRLTAIITLLSTIFIVVSLIAMIVIISFGYNS
ncbi:hypothetical protein SporoS204_01730 [Sporosarcina ureae]|uniref:DUF2768 domain-containing protein n=1 Tax=Sporosarcina ureae TaxID=1571 RepID=A0ABM6JS41_SPOUR|nr:hypothetical protein SporoS204_01730 [Sporosarcina ureae]